MSESNLPKNISGAQIIVELLYAVLALASVVLLGLRYIVSLGSEFENLTQMLDNLVCILFLTKAFWDIWQAPKKLRWLKWGWIDFIASIPEIEALRGLRLVRLLLIIRVLRSTTRSVHGIATYFNAGRSKTILATVLSLIVVSIIMSSILILGMEGSHPEANIRTGENALMWTVSTLFGADTAFFGDHFPVTMGGRIIALWLVLLSLGLIGTLAGVISAWIEQAPESDQKK